MYPGRRAEAYPDRVALVMADTGEQLTYAEYEAAANRLAHLLRAEGLQRTDHVAYFMENSLEMVVAMGAGERTGLYYTLVNSHLTTAEAAWIINDSAAEVVVTTARMAAAAGLPDLCPGVRRWLMVDRPDELAGSFEDLAEAVAPFPATPVEGEKLGMALLYSSGTTGNPKGVQRPMPDLDPSDPLPVFQLVPKVYRTRPDMVFLQPAPLYHSGPQSATAESLRCGGTCVIMSRFDAGRFLELVEKYGVTHSLVVPTMLSRILQLPEEVRRSRDVSTLEAITHGAAPCPASVKRAMIDWLGPIIYEYYGSTEANGSVICDSHEWLAHPGTVGRPLLGEVLILDPDRNVLPTGATGEVWIKGATNFVYLNDPEKTAAGRSAAGDMSTTGDIGHLDADGYLYLTDRVGFTIISGGVNIYPVEIEEVLVEHPAVADAAVIGVPHDDLGEEVKAVVELTAGHRPSPELAAEIIEFCRGRLARYKCPRSVDFAATLPRTATGKLVKRTLRDAYVGAARPA
ncbi:AMP-binding protein [Nakamurella sp. YIM 132087]|uniref:AMP-binding protein n=1 Tax=Nakamurella alba TaxID=2665158 RepID=A0A7K1FJF7_9ACTN|nr:AMP-binding protein [Nakamurella alba]MTD14206.1 AMP-binding protein [Nakamurella alba]